MRAGSPRHRSRNPTRATMKNAPPHRRARACPSPSLDRSRLCSSGAPAPELFVIRQSQTTDRKHIGTIGIAEDRPPRYDEKTPSPHRRARACPSPSFACPRLCSSGAPAPELFVIRRSQTTDGKHIGTIGIAGDRPPRYDKKRRSRAPTIAGDRPPRYGIASSPEVSPTERIEI